MCVSEEESEKDRKVMYWHLHACLLMHMDGLASAIVLHSLIKILKVLVLKSL